MFLLCEHKKKSKKFNVRTSSISGVQEVQLQLWLIVLWYSASPHTQVKHSLTATKLNHGERHSFSTMTINMTLNTC